MKNIMLIFLLIFIISVFCAHGTNSTGQSAEDIWGNKIDIQKAIQSSRPTVIVPFSTSNCGYCLIDGFFTEKNYIENNEKAGGQSFHMCLFNPQLDVYAFQKHFRWRSTILAFPPDLHQYHRDGFPTLLGFLDGKQKIRDFNNYAALDTLKTSLWNGRGTLTPTGELHIANNMIYENEMNGAVYVYPKNDSLPANTAENGKKWKAYVCKTIDQLTKEDLNKYIFLTGKFTFNEIKNFFAGSQIPFSFKNNAIEIGNYSFSFEKTGLFACFPSPFNKERYVVMLLQNENAKLLQTSNYLDYVIFTGATPENSKRLLYGKFDESSDGGWKFLEELAFSDVERKEYCKTKCELPRKRQLKANPERVVGHTFAETKRGKGWLLGNSSCRFPDIAVGKENTCWAVWEEGGDIFLARMSGDGKVDTWPVENNESDSYNPRIAVSQNSVWIFYVNDQDRFYRLYGRSSDGLRFSDEILISSKGPFDAVTPDAVSNDKGDITISWCEWKANQRYLKYRTLRSGILGDMTSMNVFPSTYTEDYTNAWYPSLCYDTEGYVWGAWNQHYPSYFGICGGKISEAAQTITQSAEKMDDWEIGGYPHLFIDGKNGKCIVWESNAWDTYPDKKAQKIKYSQYDPGQKKWAIGTVISLDEQTMLNQTPAGICDSKGTKIVVWSGRGRDYGKPWGIYLAVEKNGQWSKPALISGPDENARSPKIAIDRSDAVWVSWHSGTGKDMKTKVLRLNTFD